MNKYIKIAVVALGMACVTQVAAVDVKAMLDKVSNKSVTALCHVYGASAASAKALNSVVPGMQLAAQRGCCKFQAFRDKNPNVVEKALNGCQGFPVTEKVSKEDACRFVALGGGLLSAVPDNVRNVLAQQCCGYKDVIMDHPKAAAALKCPMEQEGELPPPYEDVEDLNSLR